MRSGDIETNPGPNKQNTISNRKNTKNMKHTPNKKNLLLTLLTLIQILAVLKSTTQNKTKIETLLPGNHSMDIKTETNHTVIYRVSMIYKQYRFCYWHKKNTKNNHKTHMVVLTLLLLCADIELNPGPTSIYPCRICERVVNDSQRAFCCD